MELSENRLRYEMLKEIYQEKNSIPSVKSLIGDNYTELIDDSEYECILEQLVGDYLTRR